GTGDAFHYFLPRETGAFVTPYSCDGQQKGDWVNIHVKHISSTPPIGPPQHIVVPGCGDTFPHYTKKYFPGIGTFAMDDFPDCVHIHSQWGTPHTIFESNSASNVYTGDKCQDTFVSQKWAVGPLGSGGGPKPWGGVVGKGMCSKKSDGSNESLTGPA